MKRLLLTIFFIFLTSICLADEVTKGHYCYTYGDNESLKEAREITRKLAMRDAIESYRAFVKSTSTVKDSQLRNDIIETISLGYLRDIKVINHTEEGRKICETIEVKIVPEEITTLIATYVKNITTQVNALQSNGYLQIVETFVREINDDSRYIMALASHHLEGDVKDKLREAVKNGKMKFKKIRMLYVLVKFLKPARTVWVEDFTTGVKAPYFASDYHFKVCVNFYAKNQCIKTMAEYINSVNIGWNGGQTEILPEILPGQEKSTGFRIPEEATSWKVWVPQ